MSPCKIADTRGKYIDQLHQIKSLLNEGQQEYSEQNYYFFEKVEVTL